MTLPLSPRRGGFLRAFGCGWFIKEFLIGKSPYGSVAVDPRVGACQAEIFFEYKQALRKITAIDKATRVEEKRARREQRAIDPARIEALADKYLSLMPYKAYGCRYHSFVTYFALLRKLRWVEPSGREEPSEFQDNYPAGQPRRYYRLTEAGVHASDTAWANPHFALYGT